MSENAKKLPDKLEGLADGLPTQEEAVLDWLADRARNAPVDLADEQLASASGADDISTALGWSDTSTEDANIGWSKGIGNEAD